VGALAIAGTGTVALDADNTFQGGISIQSGTLDLAHTGAAGGGAIRFDPGVLEFAASAAPHVALENFTTADGIVVEGFAPTGHGFQNGTLTLDGANGNITLDLPGATAGAVTVATTAGGNVDIGNVPAPCFAGGTRILTTRGEIPVEHLREGDLAMTVSGTARAIRWIGHRRVHCDRHPRPHDVWPVCVLADAFATGQPRRDLRLSPDHSVFIDGALVPIRYLINGGTIRQLRVAEVTYYHTELPVHDVILAEGLPCESYLDTGNRGAFANGGACVRMHPDFASRLWDGDACAPLVLGGPRLIAARRRVLAQAASLGLVTADPALTILADGRELAARADGRRWRARLPAKGCLP
jgi:autotransporter-associated beta strand protein